MAGGSLKPGSVGPIQRSASARGDDGLPNLVMSAT